MRACAVERVHCDPIRMEYGDCSHFGALRTRLAVLLARSACFFYRRNAAGLRLPHAERDTGHDLLWRLLAGPDVRIGHS